MSFEEVEFISSHKLKLKYSLVFFSISIRLQQALIVDGHSRRSLDDHDYIKKQMKITYKEEKISFIDSIKR